MDKKEKLMKLIRKIRLSEQFAGYRVELVPMPQYPMQDMVYDMPLHTIWINTAADPTANICRLETEKW